MEYNDSITVDELKTFLDEKDVEYQPYTQEQINQRVKELNIEKFPKMLEEYLLKIGWLDLIENGGMGNAFYRLEDMEIETAEDLKQEWAEDDMAKNEVDDYLCIGGESVSVDVFYLKIKDFDQDNPTIYGRGDCNVDTIEDGFVFGTYEYWESLKNFLGLIASSVNDLV